MPARRARLGIATGPTTDIAPHVPPAVAERFELLDLLGKGGMAEVYRAQDKVLGRQVALKLLDARAAADAELRQRLVREARAAASLKLSTVVQVHDIDPSGRFIVMELVHGETLAARLKKGPLPVPELVALARSLLGALQAAHAVGIVHRDVKPSNILLTPDGAKLTDFGVAQLPDGSDLTKSGTAVGTVSYMAPEQLRGAGGSPKSDVYSAGVTLFEAATATRFHDPSGKPCPDPRRAVQRACGDARLAEAIARAVAFDAEDRFATAEQFLAHLQRKGPTRRAITLAAAVLGAVALAAIIGPRVPQLLRSDREKRLSEGIAALKVHDLPRANAAFESVLVDDPHNAEAAYHLTLVRWWLDRSPAELQQSISVALAQKLSEPQRGLLEGLLLLQANDYPTARDHFEALAAKFPAERDIAYGLFEARYHGGYPKLAMEAHAQLRKLDPGFLLGDMHAIDYRLAHGELGEVQAVLKNQIDLPIWRLYLAVAKGELSRAAAGAEELLAKEPDNEYAKQLRFQVAVLSGSREAIDRSLVGMGQASGQKLILAALAGDDAAREEHQKEIIDRLLLEPAFGRVSLVKEMLLIDAAREGDAGAEQLLGLAAELEPRDERGLRVRMGEVFQLARLRAKERLSLHTTSPYPEVAAAAKALLAEQDGRWAEAAKQWSVAITSSGGGEYLPVEWLGLARAAQGAGDDSALLKACERALRPFKFTASWASAVAPCLTMSAEAHRRRGEADAAEKDLATLATWRR